MKISAVILGWEGTMIDFGTKAMADTLRQALDTFDIQLTSSEAQTLVNTQGRINVRDVLQDARVAQCWLEKYNTLPDGQSLLALHNEFLRVLAHNAGNCGKLLPDAVHTAAEIRRMGTQIGTTTSYAQAMTQVIAPLVREEGYTPDAIICPDQVGGMGKPHPHMLWRCLRRLGVSSIREVVKVGGTYADIQEGINAGCITVGIVKGSAIFGVSQSEYDAMSRTEIESHHGKVKDAYLNAGASFVIHSLEQLPKLLECLACNDRVNVRFYAV